MQSIFVNAKELMQKESCSALLAVPNSGGVGSGGASISTGRDVAVLLNDLKKFDKNDTTSSKKILAAVADILQDFQECISDKQFDTMMNDVNFAVQTLCQHTQSLIVEINPNFSKTKNIEAECQRMGDNWSKFKTFVETKVVKAANSGEEVVNAIKNNLDAIVAGIKQIQEFAKLVMSIVTGNGGDATKSALALAQTLATKVFAGNMACTLLKGLGKNMPPGLQAFYDNFCQDSVV